MNVSGDSARGLDRSVSGWLTRDRLTSYSIVMLVLYALFYCAWIGLTRGFGAPGIARPGSDFSVFWTASHLMLSGSPRDIYDYLIFTKTERTLFSYFQTEAFLPWLYPPAYALIVAPLALLPFYASYCVFVIVSIAAFVSGTLRASSLASTLGNSRLAAALTVAGCPCTFVTAIYGQNAFLTASLAALAVGWADRHPVRAGVCIGLLAFKPQMAVVFPFVLIAARAWRVIGVAAITALSVTVFGTLVCGAQSLHVFLANATVARELTLEHGESYWFASSTPFAVLRADGVPVVLAYAAQGCVALIAIAAACRIWQRSRDTRLRVASLAIATLSSNPYLWHYELTWLALACASVWAYRIERGWLLGEQTILLAAWLLPLYELFNLAARLPQIGPIVVLLMLWVVVRCAGEAARRADDHRLGSPAAQAR